MAIRPIIYFGDERLTRPSKPITNFDVDLQTLIQNMFDTMYAAKGIGLAAPQLGINLQLTVIDTQEDSSQPLCLINPEIIEKSGQTVFNEGCLSIPNVYGEVTRPEKIKVKALDAKGMAFELMADALLARCIQHEYDHLQGTLFIEYLTPLKRQQAIDKYLKTRAGKKRSLSEQIY